MRLRILALLLSGCLCLDAGVCLAGLRARYSPWGTIGGTGRGRSELQQPVDVAFTTGGELAIVDTRRDSVVLYTESSRWVRTLGQPRGEGTVELDSPVAIEARDEELWIVDQGNNRIVALDDRGVLLREIGGSGVRKGRFRKPSDLTFDPDGRAYVADTGNRRIQRFTPRGAVDEEWKRGAGKGRERIVRPVAVAYSRREREFIWVANEGSAVLEKYDLEGKWAGSLDLAELVEGEIEVVGISTDMAFGRLFVSDAASKRILVIRARGELAAEVAMPEGHGIGGLAMNRQLRLFVAGGISGKLVVFNRK